MSTNSIQKINWSPFFDEVPKKQLDLFRNFTETHALKQIHNQGQIINYIDCGRGTKTLFFCHGALVRGDMFFYAIKELEQTYRIIAPTFPSQNLEPLQAVKWIEIIKEKEQLNSFCVIGYSFGGGVAQLLMHFHPDWLDGVVLTHTGNLFRKISTKKMKIVSFIIRLMPFKFIIKKIRKRRKLVPKEQKWYKFYNAYFEEIAHSLKKQDFIQWINNTSNFYLETGIKSAPTFKKPMIILGTEGDTDAFQYFPTLCKLYPQAKFHIFKGDGGHHYIFLNPENYTTVLSSMISKME